MFNSFLEFHVSYLECIEGKKKKGGKMKKKKEIKKKIIQIFMHID